MPTAYPFRSLILFALVAIIGCQQATRPHQGGELNHLSEGSELAEEDLTLSVIVDTAPEPSLPNLQSRKPQSPEIQTTQPEAPSDTPLLTIQLTGAKSDRGVYSCAIFSNREDFERRSNPVQSSNIPIASEPVIWSVSDLPAGEYTIAVFHDENENGKLDRHAFGYPTEAYGFSNNARGKLGPPPFETVVFDFPADVNQTLTIRLK